ncbi:precorrin-2 C(20)-methyltransferase [Devosia ginsengisoli]|uniref:Precorrin-2 C(20)-methyltransferase n=1 Tax=Devosia ginsengisoli TaxID=400770 RepID=A0A5B8LPN0_9HYPH|nr:precorrin-2 C(20)-methyltransferase [Devosia ginsengisoli]QDZ09554.1 precorrin-2 C(20)-methyltransferase [Devosia ginsengisoli]
MRGKLIGVGTGPGDPDLLTLKAVRAIESADVIAWFAKQGNASNARAIVADRITTQIEEHLGYPVTTEIDRRHDAYKAATSAFYAEAAARVAAHLDAGRSVAVLSEGDPLFYGSYMHLHVRLAHIYDTEVIPGITAMSGCWSQAGLPLVQGDDILSVLPGTLDEVDLSTRLNNSDGAVIMKVGRNLPKIRRAIEAAGRLDTAVYVERGTMANGHAIRLADKTDDVAPYFAIVLVPGWSTRP